jgi:hypothetical protein
MRKNLFSFFISAERNNEVNKKERGEHERDKKRKMG